jgi:DNA-binding NarL/FixJ family response regulator/signal transduction histidine kinase
VRIGNPSALTTTEQGPAARPERFRDELLRPFLVLAAIVGTIAQWLHSRILFPQVALPLFILVSIAAVGALLPWARLGSRRRLAAVTAYMLLGSLLLPLAHTTTTAALFPYVAAAAAGGKLGSRKAAIGVAVAGALVAAGATWLVELLSPNPSQWPWWAALTVGLPVYIGISNRDRLDALHSAQLAAEEAQRASESEAREAALIERARIAREIHDVLGHSLSGIALQLDLADALRDNGRDEEATAAIRRARALAVDSISEARRAVHALRENTLPLPETLRQHRRTQRRRLRDHRRNRHPRRRRDAHDSPSGAGGADQRGQVRPGRSTHHVPSVHRRPRHPDCAQRARDRGPPHRPSRRHRGRPHRYARTRRAARWTPASRADPRGRLDRGTGATPMTEDLTITLVVVDDQATVRDALAVMLSLAEDVTVVATATNGAEAVQAAEQHHPDVLLMDLNMPVMNGVEATGRIHLTEPDTTILVLTTFDDDQSILAALHAGASGYLTKEADRNTILHAVRTAAQGQTVLAPEVQRRLLALASRPAPTAPPDDQAST